MGIDAPQSTDLYYRLLVDKVFYVGGMGGTAAAETLSREVRVDRQLCALCAASMRLSHAPCCAVPWVQISY